MITIFKEIFKYRELLLTLAMRDVRVRYKQSVLGVAWAIFVPLVMMLIFTFVFSRFVKFDTGGIPYPVFAYCGILPWTFFAASLTMGINSLVANMGLLTKIYFPREVFPLATILTGLVDFCIASIVLVALMIFFKVPFHLTILLVPLVVLLQIVLTAGLSLILSMANLFFRDVRYIFQVAIPLWMFVTPVIYPLKALGEKYQWLLFVNPMAPIITSYRCLILEGRLPDPRALILSVCVSFGIFIIGALWFHKAEYLFAERI